MGEKIRTSKDEIKATANTEIQKMVLREYIFDPPPLLKFFFSRNRRNEEK